MKTTRRTVILLLLGLCSCTTAGARDDEPLIEHLLRLKTHSESALNRELQVIESRWHPGVAVMLLEAARFANSPTHRARIIATLQRKTGQNFGADVAGWYQWIWAQDYQPDPNYAEFKSRLYSRIDRRFSEYFEVTDGAKIRLDEIRWGGVVRDGIPPLNRPKMISARAADNWLGDTNEVFGIELNGEARCYPKRILAWHEMFKDTIGGESFCGVY